MTPQYDNPNPWKRLYKQTVDALPMVIQHAIKNPKTSGAGIAALASLGTIHSWAGRLPVILTAVGLLLAKDGDQSGTKPNAEADAAIVKVEKMPPNTEPK